MAIPHAQAGDVIDIRPLGDRLPASQTSVLIKSDKLEVVRLILPAGKVLPEHQAKDDVLIQCLEGKVNFTTHGNVRKLEAGALIYLVAEEPHAVEALEDSSLLLTIFFTHRK